MSQTMTSRSCPPPSSRPNVSSFADTYNPPPLEPHVLPPQLPSSQAPPADSDLPPPPPPPPRRSKNRRIRHVPPGPAGVWFQSQRHAASSSSTKTGASREASSSFSWSSILSPSRTPSRPQNISPSNAATADVSSCPAWSAMQRSLHLCTPFLPPYLSVNERYQQLRPHLPSQYVLIPDLRRSGQLVLGKDRNSTERQSLLVLVQAVQCHSNHDWTVELQDESGATIRAWLDPQWMEQEQDQGGNRMIQMGHVWQLQRASILVSDDDYLWLLIKRNNVKQVWTSKEELDNEQYLEWTQARNRLMALSSSSTCAADSEDHQGIVRALEEECEKETNQEGYTNEKQEKPRTTSTQDQLFFQRESTSVGVTSRPDSPSLEEELEASPEPTLDSTSTDPTEPTAPSIEEALSNLANSISKTSATSHELSTKQQQDTDMDHNKESECSELVDADSLPDSISKRSNDMTASSVTRNDKETDADALIVTAASTAAADTAASDIKAGSVPPPEMPKDDNKELQSLQADPSESTVTADGTRAAQAVDSPRLSAAWNAEEDPNLLNVFDENDDESDSNDVAVAAMADQQEDQQGAFECTLEPRPQLMANAHSGDAVPFQLSALEGVDDGVFDED